MNNNLKAIFENMTNADLKRAPAVIESLRKERKTLVEARKKAKKDNLGDYFEATYRFMPLGKLFEVKTDGTKTKIKLKTKTQHRYGNDYQEVLSPLDEVVDLILILEFLIEPFLNGKFKVSDFRAAGSIYTIYLENKDYVAADNYRVWEKQPRMVSVIINKSNAEVSINVRHNSGIIDQDIVVTTIANEKAQDELIAFYEKTEKALIYISDIRNNFSKNIDKYAEGKGI